ncbi:MAG: cation diffusion facilitator family transporter [Candidatus Contendobacter sp.]|nr:cation diffusion facilitator family transporter [Candidatus Contendobacter sp.]
MNPSRDHAPHHHGETTGRVLWLATALTLAYAAVEAGVGWWAGSLALVADAGHMVNDAAALALAAVAAWLAGRTATARHSYGFGRAEFIAALINSLGLLILVAWIAVSAVQRLHQPQPVMGEAVSVAAAVGLILNIGVAWLLSRGERNLNTRAALLHVLGDLLGSVAALLAGVVIAFTGWMPIDPLLGAVFGFASGPCAFAWIAPVLGAAWLGVTEGLLAPVLLLALFAAGHCAGVWLAADSLDRVQRWLDRFERRSGLRYGRFACGGLLLMGGGYLLAAA